MRVPTLTTEGLTTARLRSLVERGHASSRCTAWEVVACGSLLALVAAVAFGSHVRNGGFYNDDWAFATTFAYAPEPGLLGAIRAFDWYSFRPVSMLYLPAMYEVFGMQAGLHLALVTLTAVALSGALYWLLRTLAMERLHAGAVAVLVLLFPASDANRHWAAASIALPAIALYLAGAALALKGLAARGRRAIALHAGAVVLYVLSVMTYEIAAGAILLSVLLYRLRGTWDAALSRWLVDVAAVVPVLLLVTSGSWNEPQPLGTTVRHAGTVADGAVTILAHATVPFGNADTRIVITLLALVAATGVVVWRLRPPADPVGRELGRWLSIALAAICAIAIGYAIFIPADPDSYSPLMPGQGNRVNGLAAIGFVLLIYALAMVAATLVARGARLWREWSAGLATALALLLAWGWLQRIDAHTTQWDRSAAAQADVVTHIDRAVPASRPDTTIYAVRLPTLAAPGVPIFGSTWDLAGALAIEWNEPSISAFPAVPGTSFACGERKISAQNWLDAFDPQTAEYGRAIVVDVAASTAVRVRDRASCLSAARRFSTDGTTG
jgi:hypothetical protein